MPFVWVPTPQVPSPNIPDPIGPSEVSYKVDVVANTVDWGGEVRYNTANHAYDIVYEFPSLNASMMVIDNAFFDTATINTLNSNVMTANTVTLGTANVANLFVTYGTITGNALSNLSVVTKEYVDNAIASISGGTGFDTTANLFLTKGDLIVGFSPNTAHRLAGGSNGQVLTVNTASNIKVSWEDAPTPQETLGLFIGSHWHPYKKQTTVLLKRANAIVMENGDYVTGWNNLTANLMSSGAGGLDSPSSLVANTWYSVYAIYNPNTGNKALLLHQLKSRIVDQTWPVAADSEIAFLGFNITAATNPFQRYCTKISQSFIPSISSPIYGIELRIGTQTIPSGNCWVTLEPDDGLGNASGTILATSRIITSMERGPVGGSSSETSALFIFDTTTSLSPGSRYHFVVNTDRPVFVSATESNCITVQGNTAPLGPGQLAWMANVGYNVGPALVGYGDSRTWNAAGQRWWTTANTGTAFSAPSDLYFKIHHTINDNAVVLPSGYTQKALIGYACTNTQSRLKEYKQINRTMCMGFDNDWWGWRSAATPSGDSLIELSHVVPPVVCAVQFLVNQQATPHQGPGTVTPSVTTGTFFNIPWFSARGIFHHQSRSSQIYPTPPMEISDTQRVIAYQIDTSTLLYIASITF